MTANAPPIVAGSRKIKITGLPTGCAPGSFTFRAVANDRSVKKMKAALFYWDEGDGITPTKRTNGKALKATGPVVKLENQLAKAYKLVIKAKRARRQAAVDHDGELPALLNSN